MNVTKTKLMAVLNAVKPGLSKQDVVEQATHFVFANNEVSTYNDNICIMHPFECDLEFSARGDDLFKIIAGINEDELELSMTGDVLNIQSKKTKAALATTVEETSMVAPLIDMLHKCIAGKKFWKPVPSDFLQGMNLCSFSAAKDLSSGVKSCCAIQGDAIHTTDNIRASVYTMDSAMAEVLLPSRYVSELIKYKIKEYGISENWAHFRTEEGIVFNCKQMKGEYPFDKVQALFIETKPVITFPFELKDTILSMVVLAEGESTADKFICLEVGGNQIICKAKRERGWITKVVSCEYTGEKFTVLINPVFFSQVISFAPEFAAVQGRGMFFSTNFKHVLALPQGE